MDYIETLPVFLIVKIRGHSKFIIRGQQLIWMEISTGPCIIFDQAGTGSYTFVYGKINGAMVNSTPDHRSCPGPVFPSILTSPLGTTKNSLEQWVAVTGRCLGFSRRTKDGTRTFYGQNLVVPLSFDIIIWASPFSPKKPCHFFSQQNLWRESDFRLTPCRAFQNFVITP